MNDKNTILLRDIAQMAHVDFDDARSLFNVIIRELQTMGVDDKIRIDNFGILSVCETEPRCGRNPKTGESVDIPARRKLKFKFSRMLQRSAR
jgi:DNA-binding protein HU-beta